MRFVNFYEDFINKFAVVSFRFKKVHTHTHTHNVERQNNKTGGTCARKAACLFKLFPSDWHSSSFLSIIYRTKSVVHKCLGGNCYVSVAKLRLFPYQV